MVYNEQLEIFICVVECNSFSKAADKLYLSPNAVMKRINLLENQFGLTLFERLTQGLSLTPAGSSFYNDAKEILRQTRESVNRAKNAVDDMDRTLRIGNASGFPAEFFSKIWPELCRRCGNFMFKYIHYDASEDDIKSMIRELGEKTDIVMDFYDEDYISQIGYGAEKLCDAAIGCIVPYTHRLAEKELITKEDLAGETILVAERENSDYWSKIWDFLEQCPGVTVKGYSMWDMEIYDKSESQNLLLMNTMIYKNINPFRKMIPVDWNYKIPFGVWYRKNQISKIRDFLDAVKQISEAEKK